MLYRRNFTCAAALCSVFILIGLASNCNKPKQEPGRKKSSTAAPQKVVSKEALNTGDLIGRWARTDGGYTLDIKSIPSTGYPDIAYFNPAPIKVGDAQVSTENGVIKVYVMFDDPEKGYPGSIYQLEYNKEADVLAGTYFQAVMKQEYSISFIRVQ